MSLSEATGFLISVESLDVKGRCELHFYGVGTQGPFKIIYDSHKPLFFVSRTAGQDVTAPAERRRVELVDFHREPVDALYYQSLDSYFQARRSLRENRVRIYESDVRAEDRFLMERKIKGALHMSGESFVSGKLEVFRNPSIAPAEYRPELKWMSFDIETGTDGTLYSVSFHLTGRGEEIRKVIIRGEKPDRHPEWLEYCPGERELLERFIDFVLETDPDLLIGWHVIGFDLRFLDDRCTRFSIPFNIGRGDRAVRLIEKKSGLHSAEIEGRLVIDGPQTLRTAFYKFDNFKLETVARELLGRGKDITPEKDKVAEIERRFREDKEALAFYNLEDSVLVTEIFRKTAIIDQLVTRSIITGLTADKVHMSVASFDYFMLPLIHRKGYVAPDTADMEAGDHAAGGLVFSSDAGLYHNVAVMDFKSLYPTIMRTFFIDPLSLLRAEEDPVETPVGIRFSRTFHVLPEFLAELMEKRAAAKKSGDANLAQAVKILMNSFYGVMGTTGCRFYHADLPTAITGTGQWILKTCSSWLASHGYEVLYGDTDSVFVKLKKEEWGNPTESGLALEKQINYYFRDLLMEKFHVESKLEIEFEKHYTQFFLPPMRNSREGARKRYAGLLDTGDLEFKGLETVRSDWTPLAREFQQELFNRFFRGREVKLWIRGYVDKLRNGEMDDKLVYRKRLSRTAGDYVKSRPPHVKAALLLDPGGKKNLKEISYVMSADGPVPAEMFNGGADYSHYIEKQLKPIADGVLFAMGEDFDSLLEGRQLNLF